LKGYDILISRVNWRCHTKRSFLFVIVLLLSMSLSACNLPINAGHSGAISQTEIALNVALTQFAVSQTAAVPPTAEPTATVAIPTAAPEVLSPPNTPEPAFTPTRGGVWLTVQENTNCRSGPGSLFDFMGLINAGQQVEAVARSTVGEYYYIKNPTSYSDYCWLWSRYTTIAGDTGTLPVFTPQPSPTPKVTSTFTKAPADFFVRYENTQHCSEPPKPVVYGLQLYVENTGSTTWESIKVKLVNETRHQTTTFEQKLFFGVLGCTIEAIQQNDLTPGEFSLVALYGSSSLNYNPAGESFTAQVTLYSGNDYTGISVTKTIAFTP